MPDAKHDLDKIGVKKCKLLPSSLCSLGSVESFENSVVARDNNCELLWTRKSAKINVFFWREALKLFLQIQIHQNGKLGQHDNLTTYFDTLVICCTFQSKKTSDVRLAITIHKSCPHLLLNCVHLPHLHLMIHHLDVWWCGWNIIACMTFG